MTNDKSKATWDTTATKMFIELCLEQVHKNERKGGTFTKKGWKDIRAGFNEKSRRQYDKTQLKNKWDNLRKEWVLWDKLFGEEADLKWDNARNTVDAPDDWWAKKLLENPQYEKFRYKGLPFAQELTTLFKSAPATGNLALAPAPSSGTLPNDTNAYVYHSPLNDGCVNLDEGTGDCDENLGNAAGLIAEVQSVNLNTSQGNSSEGNGRGKRKRGEATDKKMKVPTSKKIADAIIRIAAASESRSQMIARTSISEVIAELQKMEAITSDPDWHSRCCQLLLSQPEREMFIALKPYEENLLNWLKFAAYRI
ncbi:L10-interacting MYB domain-containing protein-like [Prosopis cineraria]|uniref:L10-interacting MYB domain-containing protein-like n=1 Tax=Prosopis cineraria TaxID=364024 RepID=UPI00240EA2D4|nr:L10-interacting MYB domain-containing protein-like [Prosopis cineraria]XP_054806175.1 L10-interacting MYB domain-containing protein-like [Prosopis cineraria]